MSVCCSIKYALSVENALDKVGKLKVLLNKLWRITIFDTKSFRKYSDDKIKLFLSYNLPHYWTKHILWPEILVKSKYIVWSCAFDTETYERYSLTDSRLLIELYSRGNINDVISKVEKSINWMRSEEYKNLMSYFSI